MQLDCIPAGMELFPAADKEQLEFIKRVIDDCDYYLLIIGGRYGSMAAEGVSYTELEFDYAVSKGMKVVAFLHADPGSIPVNKSEVEPTTRQRLHEFCEKVKAGRLVSFWSNASELPGLVALSLPKTIKMFPAIGWVRADTVASTELLGDMNDLRKENEKLRRSMIVPQIEFGDIKLAGLDEVFLLQGNCTYERSSRAWTQKMTWRNIFATVAPLMVSYANAVAVKIELAKIAFSSSQWKGLGGHSPRLDEQVFLTVGIQLRALELVKADHLQTTQGGVAEFWRLTPIGEKLMIQERAVRSTVDDALSQETVESK